MIRVLFIGMTYNPGGLETYMINIFSRLQGKGFQFYFINTYRNKSLAYSTFIKKNRGIIYNVPLKNNILTHISRFNKIKRFFKFHHNFDIVHINALSINEVYWIKASRKYRIKNIIFQSHESNDDSNYSIMYFLRHMWGDINKYRLNKDDNVTQLAASRDCGKWMFGENSKFTVINNGIDTKYFKPRYKQRIYLRKKLHIDKREKVIITTARLQKQKNYPKIINVFKCIHKLDKATLLVIIGSGQEENCIKSMVKSLKLSKHVIFLGAKDKKSVSLLLNIGDLMLMPSFYEAVPFSLTEAQSVGVPAIVSLNRIPKEANITNNIEYLSLRDSDNIWAKRSLSILHKPFNFNLRLKMNNMVKNSKYNIDVSVNIIKYIYLKLYK